MFIGLSEMFSYASVTGEMLSKPVQGQEGWGTTKTNIVGDVSPSPCTLEAGKVVLEMTILPL